MQTMDILKLINNLVNKLESNIYLNILQLRANVSISYHSLITACHIFQVIIQFQATQIVERMSNKCHLSNKEVHQE